MTKSKIEPLLNNLNTYSYYSLLSSTLSIDEIINFALENKKKYVSLSDKNLYGAIEFYNKAIKNNLIPIIGIDIEYKNINLLLFAKNWIGYKNLIKISSFIETKQEFDLNSFLKEIIIIKKNNVDSNFLEYPFFNLDKNDPNRIACNEARYLKKTDNIIYTSIQNIKTGNSINNESELEKNFNLYLLNNKETIDTFDDVEILNLNNSIKEIDLKIEPVLDNIISPIKSSDKNESSFFLKKTCVDSLNEKILNNIINKNQRDIYFEKMEYELEVINNMGFNEYFLIVWDFINEANNKDILVGPGRGSSAGSLVAYLLGITKIDPIKYNLFFERFLNPGRISLPDIDIDIMDIKRDEIINYIFNKYGYDHVCQITTFQRIKAKMAIRDIGRMLKIDLKIINKICKLISPEFDDKLEDALKKIKELNEYSNEFSLLFLISKKIINFPRQAGIHAAGIILSKEKLVNIIPIQNGINGNITSQYSMEYLEQLGLLKIDILGLTNLTTIYNVLKLIKKIYKKDISLEQINLENDKVFNEISKANTLGIFQLESPGMRNLLKQIKPKNIEDISLCSALYRPGPQQNIKSFLNRRNGKEEIEYIDFRSENILKPTYGIIVYQEQVIELVKNVANFSLSEADMFRRIISKKNLYELNDFREKFIDASIKNGYSEKHISDIYNYIYTFSHYGFVHSHSIAYSLIGYWMLYLKTFYPHEFMIILMASFDGNLSKIETYVNECKRLKIEILPPSINLSSKTFSLYKRQILFGFNCIKSIGEETSKKIINIRAELKDNLFINFPTTIKLLTENGIGENTIETLILSNAFNDFKLSKKYMIENLKEAISSSKNIKNDGSYLFDPNWIEVEETEEDDNYFLKKELDLLGINFSTIKNTNFMKFDEIFLKQNNIVSINDLELSERNGNIVGIIINIKKLKTKNLKNMAFIKINDGSKTIDTVCFIDKFLEDDFLKLNKNYIFTLKYSIKNYQLIGIKEVI